MSLEGLMAAAVVSVAAVAGGLIWHAHAVDVARDEGDRAGYARAVAIGNARYEAERDNNLVRERALRAQLADRDAAAMKQEQTYAENLAAAQRRVRAGTDLLRCPAASPVPGAATAADRPAAGGTAPDGPGAAIVPEVAADILSLAADTGRLVRKYGRLEQRFDECRALNNGAAPAEVQ